MKKEYMKPDAEKISFLTEEDLMTDGLEPVFPDTSTGLEPWSLLQ